MSYVYGNIGKVDSSPIGGSSSSSSSTSRNITEVITTTTIQTTSGTKTWKGDPNNLGAITAWKASYEPGYTSQIISPRDSSGNYTSNPKEIEQYSIISKEQQAKEIAVSLKGETGVPTSIVQSLAKTLGAAKEKITHKNAPTGITDTKRITGDNTVGGYDLTTINLPFIAIAITVIIIGSIIIKKM